MSSSVDWNKVILGSIPGFQSLQEYCDNYGISFEDFQETGAKFLSTDPQYIVKFSIPESWDMGEDFPKVDPEAIRKEFKNRFKDLMIATWKKSDSGFEDDFYDYAISLFKFLCRTRKGQIWTAKNRDAELAKHEELYHQAKQLAEREKEYDEV